MSHSDQHPDLITAMLAQDMIRRGVDPASAAQGAQLIVQAWRQGMQTQAEVARYVAETLTKRLASPRKRKGKGKPTERLTLSTARDIGSAAGAAFGAIVGGPVGVPVGAGVGRALGHVVKANVELHEAVGRGALRGAARAARSVGATLRPVTERMFDLVYDPPRELPPDLEWGASEEEEERSRTSPSHEEWAAAIDRTDRDRRGTERFDFPAPAGRVCVHPPKDLEVDRTVHELNEATWPEVLRRGLAILGRTVQVGKHLGCGSWGCVYEVDANTIVKITGDRTEAAAVARFLEAFPNGLDGVIPYQRVYALDGAGPPDQPVYAVFAPKADGPIPRGVKPILDEAFRNSFLDEAFGEDRLPKRFRPYKGWRAHAGEYLPQFVRLLRTLRALDKAGIRWEDLHADNLMVYRGKWAIVDIGRSQHLKPRSIPALRSMAPHHAHTERCGCSARPAAYTERCGCSARPAAYGGSR